MPRRNRRIQQELVNPFFRRLEIQLREEWLYRLARDWRTTHRRTY